MRIIAIFKRIMLQRRGDPRTLAMMFLAPIFILTLMYFLFQVPSNTAYRVGLKSDNTELTKALKNMPDDKAHLEVVNVSKNNRLTMSQVFCCFICFRIPEIFSESKKIFAKIRL